jgi:NADH:ubiquinone reductase (H+-translocating)
MASTSPCRSKSPSLYHLVIAMGSQLDHSKIPGMREHASPFKYLGDALYLRNQLVRILEEAEAEAIPKAASGP